MKSIAIAAALALAAGSATAIEHGETAVSITPSYSSTTRSECATPSTSGGWIGPALGAIIGGGAGSQIGKGSGQAAAAAIGATLGAQAGAAMSGNVKPTQACRDVSERTLNGYMLRTNAGRDVFIPLHLINR